MWHRDGPTFLTDNVWVGISFDGTKLWQASFVHFAVGDLGSHMPLGSWILLRGSEKKAIISQLAEVYDLNADLTEVAQQQIPDKGGYLRKVICFFIADTKAQVILGGCSSFTAKNPAATVCWLCGKNRATILHEFGCGMGVIVEEWLWAGIICPIVRPAQRPPDYGLHGVHRQVHNGLSALVNSLHTVHRWKRGKAVRWVQWFLDPIRIQARTATGVALEEERKDKKKVPLKIEQTAAAEWVKSEGWDTMCDHLEGEGLLQHVVDMGGVQVSWTDAFRQWGKSLLATSDVVWKSGPLQLPDMKILRTELKKMGEAHKACEMNVTLWAHLWIDHLLGWARRWGHIAIFAAFKGEGRHKALKCEISKRSFRGGSKGGRVSRLRGARVRVKGGKGDRTRKGWGEVIRSDNLAWGLYNKKFSVWESSWTKQRGYIENKGVFVQAEQGM